MESSFLAELHPKIVHFPVALLSTYGLLETAGILLKREFISRCALLLLCLGVIASVFAVLSGNEAFSSFQFWTDESIELLNEHQNYASFLLWFSSAGCAARIFLTLKKKFVGYKKYVFIIFSIIILFLVYKTGEHGGKLVTKFGIGTEIITGMSANSIK